jgi:putative toxin-antitoxin system antitoxin component (TIGR02293 family)
MAETVFIGGDRMEDLEFYDGKSRRRFISSDWRIEAKESGGQVRYFAVAKAPTGTHEAWRRISEGSIHRSYDTAPHGSISTHDLALGSANAIQSAALIGVNAPTLGNLIEKVEAGLPYRAFERLEKLLDMSARELGDVLKIPPRTLIRRKKSGHLIREESERVLRFTRIITAALSLFEGDQDGANAWMRRENRALGGKTPLGMARTEIGGEEVLNLIGRLEYGVIS